MPDDVRLPTPTTGHLSILRDPSRFEFTQRVARLYSESKLVPEHLQKNISDCFIALQMADAMGEDPLMVMQNIYIVNAKAGWSAAYMIARANRSGIFRGPLRWRTKGQGIDLEVTCYGDLAHVSEGERVEVTVSMATAKADGWTRNAKYASMPEQMLRWRSATWLIRLYCPEVMMGLPTADEVEDTWGNHLTDVTPPPRPEPADFAEPSAAPRVPRRGRPRAEPAATEEPAAAPVPAEAVRGIFREAPYFFSDEDGEVHEFEDVNEAIAIYAERLEAARGNRQLLEATWENGARLLAALRERGHTSAADALNAEYGRLQGGIEAAEAPAATSTEPDDGEPEYDVLVPRLEGMNISKWHMTARLKLMEMDKLRRPARDYVRFRKAHETELAHLKGEWSSFHANLMNAIDKGISGA
jgi:hypothetical protein